MKKRIDYPIFKIIANVGLSSPDRGEGRFYPLLLIDASMHAGITDLFQLHQEMPPGDTVITWGKKNGLFAKDTILYLSLEFEKPMYVSFAVEFDVEREFALIDGIIRSRGVCIASGKLGDRAADHLKDSIIIEVPNLGFDNHWNNLLISTLKKNYKKKGIAKKEVSKYTSEHIKRMREIWNIRRDNLD